MTEKVVGLHGNTKFDYPEKSEVVVETIKALLSRAEAGEILGAFVVTVDRDTCTTGYMVGRMSASMFGRICSMMAKQAIEYEEEDP